MFDTSPVVFNRPRVEFQRGGSFVSAMLRSHSNGAARPEQIAGRDERVRKMVGEGNRVTASTCIAILRRSSAKISEWRRACENQMPWADDQKQLGHSIAATRTPAPELFAQAARMKTPAVLCQSDRLTTQQLNKLVERITEHEAETE